MMKKPYPALNRHNGPTRDQIGDAAMCALCAALTLFVMFIIWALLMVSDSGQHKDPNTLYKRIFHDYRDLDYSFPYAMSSSVSWYPPDEDWAHYKKRACECLYSEKFAETPHDKKPPERKIKKSCWCRYD